MSRVAVSIILVSHRTERVLPACVAGLADAARGVPYELIVVNVGDRAREEARFPDAVPGAVMIHVANRGFGAAVNAGAAVARGSCLLFLNPDAVLPSGAVRRLRALCLAPGVAAASGVLIGPGGHPESSGEPFPSLWWYVRRRLRTPQLLTFNFQQATPYSVPWLSGAALMVRADVFRAAGGFDERYFLYYEDIDLCRRLRARGGTLVLDPQLLIRHHGGASAPRPFRVAASDQAEDAYFARYRARWEALALAGIRALLHAPVRLVAGGALGGALAATFGVPTALALAVGATVAAVSARVPDGGALLLLGTLLLGQLVRVPVSGSVTLSVTDAVLPMVLGGWSLRALRAVPAHRRIWARALWLLVPIAAVLPGLLLARERLPEGDWLVAGGYSLRLLLVLGMVPLAVAVLRRPAAVVGAVAGVAVLLALAGFLQLLTFPALPAFVAWWEQLCGAPACLLRGFDPHQGRLFASWMDPNLLGGFFVVALAALLGIRGTTGLSRRWAVAALCAGSVIVGALVLTKSRTSLLAAVAAAGLALLLARPWRRLLALGSLGLLGLALLPALAGRLTTFSTEDPTARLRLTSWTQAVEHLRRFPWFGTGYNAYGFEQLAAGNLHSLTIHSRAGADNSFLTFAATTGIWGSALLGVGLLAAFWSLARAPGRWGLPAALALAGLVAHSQFVNSLLYVHLAVPTALLIAAAMSTKHRTPNTVPAGQT